MQTLTTRHRNNVPMRSGEQSIFTTGRSTINRTVRRVPIDDNGGAGAHIGSGIAPAPAVSIAISERCTRAVLVRASGDAPRVMRGTIGRMRPRVEIRMGLRPVGRTDTMRSCRFDSRGMTLRLETNLRSEFSKSTNDSRWRSSLRQLDARTCRRSSAAALHGSFGKEGAARRSPCSLRSGDALR